MGVSGDVPVYCVAVIGDTGCGKSSLIARVVRNDWPFVPPPHTAHATMSTRLFSFGSGGEGGAACVELWEIPGTCPLEVQAEDKSGAVASVGRIDGAILVIDCTHAMGDIVKSALVRLAAVEKWGMVDRAPPPGASSDRMPSRESQRSTRLDGSPLSVQTSLRGVVSSVPVVMFATKSDVLSEAAQGEALKLLDAWAESNRCNVYMGSAKRGTASLLCMRHLIAEMAAQRPAV